jgi:hypothetical protein
MRNLLRRLLDALPLAERWIGELRAAHSAESVSASELGLPRLSDHFPADVLEHARVVTVAEIPFPPVSAYGLPEFEGMAATPMAAITFGDMYFVRPDAPLDRARRDPERVEGSERVHFHELVHVVQWNAVGIPAFLLTYAVGLLQHGYAQSPLEAIAFDLQMRFERGARLESVVDEVAQHAAATRDAATSLFRAHGLDMRVAFTRREQR